MRGRWPGGQEAQLMSYAKGANPGLGQVSPTANEGFRKGCFEEATHTTHTHANVYTHTKICMQTHVHTERDMDAHAHTQTRMQTHRHVLTRGISPFSSISEFDV